VLLRVADGPDGFRQRPDLVRLDKNGVRGFVMYGPLQPAKVRDEKVIPYELNLLAQFFR
jgi:hypothetical protein